MLNMENMLELTWALLRTPELVGILGPNFFLVLCIALEHLKETGLSQINLKLL